MRLYNYIISSFHSLFLNSLICTSLSSFKLMACFFLLLNNTYVEYIHIYATINKTYTFIYIYIEPLKLVVFNTHLQWKSLIILSQLMNQDTKWLERHTTHPLTGTPHIHSAPHTSIHQHPTYPMTSTLQTLLNLLLVYEPTKVFFLFLPLLKVSYTLKLMFAICNLVTIYF